MAETAIFLGAGASKAEGAPLQGELFWEYFSSPAFRRSRAAIDRELAAFFGEMFSIDVKRRDLRKDAFPHFRGGARHDRSRDHAQRGLPALRHREQGEA